SHLQKSKIPYHGTLGSAILKVFDLTVAATGHTTSSLENLGYAFKEVTLDTYSHAGYYPGSEKLSLKILFDGENGAIYGAQGVGLAGVDKRLAVLTTAIKGKLTVADLPELEHAYAPPYSSPKDPVNIIGYKAAAMLENKETRRQFTMSLFHRIVFYRSSSIRYTNLKLSSFNNSAT